MISFLKLIRCKNLLMVLLTMVLTKHALIESVVDQAILSNSQFLTLLFSVLLITAGGYIINDIFDIEADKINKPNKIFIGKIISKKNAWIVYSILSFTGFFLGALLSYYINNFVLFLVFIFSILSLFIYSSHLKKRVLIGNLTIAFLISLSIMLVYFLKPLNNISNSNIWGLLGDSMGYSISIVIAVLYVVFSFLTTLIREIIKDIEDINGDLKINAKTLPIVFGRKRANRVAFSISIILMILLIFISKSFLIEFPIFLGYSIVFVLLPLLFFMYKLWNAESKKEYSKLSQLMKMIMFFGILSMLFFKFI